MNAECKINPEDKVGLGALLLFCLMALMLAVKAFAAPFVTPDMTLRNGLTDEQYEMLWKQGKNPKIDIATARDWIYRSSRFQNVTNWLGVIGKTNDFARLVYPTMTTNEILTATNRVLTTAVGKLRQDLEKEIARADSAEYDANIYKAVQKAAKRAEKNLAKVIKEVKKARDKASTEEEIALYTMLIELLQGNEPNN